MWKLTISDAFVSSYKDRMLPGLVQRVKQWGYPFPEIQARLLPDFNSKTPRDTDILIHLLTDRPQDAYDLNNRLMSEFVKDADGNSCYGESTLENHSSPGPYSITTASYLSPRANHIGLQSISVAIPAHTAIGNIPSLLEVLMTNHGRRVLTLTIGFRSPYSRCSR